ncbi:autoinducer 2 ABC transporter substrate-binding protein [Oceanivirga salmonicida]|uniref:autoinducer 2 ABC transporter substrate-binding protein n=1 Tax=Oceanivirga salmonicida TaxID=1769291 RepID=UPI000830888E|nr:autoinducer 2 ABC transporter substrate-binding protein [Oceanivirga salmonicida]
MKKISKFVTRFVSTILLLGAFVACGKKEEIQTAKKENKKLTIAIMPKLVGIPYFNQTSEGAEKAGKDLGVEVIYTGPTKADAAEQVKMIEDLINRGVDAIAVAPNDPAAVIPVLQKAKAAGIVVLDWDTPTDIAIVDASVRQIDDKEIGEKIIQKLVEYMGTDEGDYAIVTGGLSAENLNKWIQFGLDYSKEHYPKLNLVTDKIPTDEKQQEAYSKTLDLIKAYPNIKGIAGYSTVAPLGVAQAIREKGLQDKIAVVGNAVKEDAQDFLSDGSLDAGVLWNPKDLGYLTISVAKALLEGKELKDGMEAEGFGKISVKEGKIIIMGPSSVYEK